MTVALEKNDGTFRLSVRDTGIGIPADKLQYIFQRFNQVDSTLSRRYEGTGIGLSLAKDIVELHRGSIAVQSVLGQGSEFIITMPIGTVDEAAPLEELKALKPSILSDIQDRVHTDSGDDGQAGRAGSEQGARRG